MNTDVLNKLSDKIRPLLREGDELYLVLENILQESINELEHQTLVDAINDFKSILNRTADILHSRQTNHCPLRGYGLTVSSQMKAAAKVLRIIACDIEMLEVKK